MKQQKRFKLIWLLVLLLIVAGFSAYKGILHLNSDQASEVSASTILKMNNETKYIDALVTEVVDGDTLHVLINNKKETVRLVLVDTPETKHPTKPIEPFGPEASKFTKDLLEGKTVKLEQDVSATDRYGRLLKYVWLNDQMVNEILLEKGLARVAVFPPDVKYVEAFRAVQKEAQMAKIGIWSLEDYVQDNGFEPKPTASASAASNQKVVYASCAAVRAAGKSPIRKDDPGYSRLLDRDGDGIGCE